MSNIATDIVLAAVSEVNEDLDGSAHIAAHRSTALLSSDSSVDSLSLVKLLVAVERLIEEQTGKTLVIVDESAFDAQATPFVSVGSLIDHVQSLLDK